MNVYSKNLSLDVVQYLQLRLEILRPLARGYDAKHPVKEECKSEWDLDLD